MSYVASELRHLRREVVRLNRKLAMSELPGIVTDRDPKTRKVRLNLGQDPDTGTKVLSPWVRVQSGSAGKFKSFVLPSVGEQMTLYSASGIVGADSVARYGTFTDANPHPEQDPDEAVLFENGQTRIAVKDGRLIHKVGKSTTTVTDGKVVTAIGDSTVTHEGAKVTIKVAGSTHVVEAGQITSKSSKVTLDAAVRTTGKTDLATGLA